MFTNPGKSAFFIVCLICSPTLASAADIYSDFGLTGDLFAPAGYNKAAVYAAGPYEFFGMQVAIIERDLQADPEQADNGYAYVDFQLGVTRVPATQRQPVRITIDPNQYGDRYWGNIETRVLENIHTGQTFFYFVETLIPTPGDEPFMRLLALENNGQAHSEQFFWDERLDNDFRAQFFRQIGAFSEVLHSKDRCFGQLITDEAATACNRIASDIQTLLTDGDAYDIDWERLIDAPWFMEKARSADLKTRRATMELLALGRFPLIWPDSINLLDEMLDDSDHEVWLYSVNALLFWLMANRRPMPQSVVTKLNQARNGDQSNENKTIDRLLQFNEQLQQKN